MVKDVVKSEYRMIVMWSLVWGGRSARKSLRRQRKNLGESREETHQLLYVVNSTKRNDKHVVRKIKQPRAENYLVLLLQMLYCNLELHDCQGPLRIKINAQNLIRSKQRKKLVAIISIM